MQDHPINFQDLITKSISLQRPLSSNEPEAANQAPKPMVYRSLNDLAKVSSSLVNDKQQSNDKSINAYKLLSRDDKFDTMKLEDYTSNLEGMIYTTRPTVLPKVTKSLQHIDTSKSINYYINEKINTILHTTYERTQYDCMADFETTMNAWNTKIYNKEIQDKIHCISGRFTTNINTKDAMLKEEETELPKEVLAYGKIIKELNHRTIKPNTLQLLSNFSSVLHTHTDNNTSIVSSAYDLLSTMIVACSENEGRDVKECMAFGALQHLCSQYKSFIQNKLISSSNVISAQHSSSAFLGQLASYIELQRNYDIYITQPNPTTTMWQMIYYSLRCGDVTSAYTTAVNTSNSNPNIIEPCIISVLQHLSLQQPKNESSLFTKMKLHGEYIPTSLLNPIVQLYHRMKARSTIQNSSKDNFYLGVLSLLSCTEPPPELTTTIEDYFFSRLWLYVINKESNILQQLKTQILSCGSSYFNSDTTDPWSYVIPLFICQQFQTAFLYLIDSMNNGSTKEDYLLLVHTIHFCFLFQYTNIPCVDNSFDGTKIDDSNDFISRLFLTYIQQFSFQYPELALEYIVHIPNPTISKKQIIDLLLYHYKNKSEFSKLVGSLKDDGSRTTTSALDTHLSDYEVCNILYECGQSILMDRSIDDTRICFDFLCLSGRYSAVLEYLNRQLGNLLQEDGDVQRYWRDIAHDFYHKHLHTSSSNTNSYYIVSILEKDSTTFRIKTLYQLLQIYSFLHHMAERKFEQAWNIINALQIFPTTKEDIRIFTQDVEYDIQKNINFTVLKAMECLQFLYHFYQNEKGRLVDIRKRAKELVTFVGLVRMDGNEDIYSRISRMEALMLG